MFNSGMFHAGLASHPYLENAGAMRLLVAKAQQQRGELMKAVQTVGTPPNSSTSDLARFVPEDLQKIWSAETAGDDEIVVSRNKLPRVDAHSTRHKWIVVEEYGNRYATHFFPETGRLPTVNSAKSRDDYCDLKLFGERRQISNLVEAVAQIGNINAGGAPIVSKIGRQRETSFAIKSISLAYEHAFLWGDSAIDPNEFDGIVKQVKTKGVANVNVHDLRGGVLTFARMLRDASKLRGKPYHGKIEEFWITDLMWASLAVETTDSARWTRNGAEFVNNDGWRFNPNGYYLISPRKQRIEFVIVPALAPEVELPTAAWGTAPTLTLGGNITSITPGGTGSQFELASANFRWAIKGIFANGAALHYVTNTTAVDAGEEVVFVHNDASLVSDSANPLLWYEIWRTDETDGTPDLTTLKPLMRVPVGNVSGHTEWTDTNAVLPGTETVLGVQISEMAMFTPTLLPKMRFPIPFEGFVRDFIVAGCDAPAVAHGNRQLIYLNAGLNLTGLEAEA